jgi:hypothetical protein
MSALPQFSYFTTFRRMLFARAAIGPARPIATAMLLVASHVSHPMPDPAIALNKAAIASERADDLLFGFGSILPALSVRLFRLTPKLLRPPSASGIEG